MMIDATTKLERGFRDGPAESAERAEETPVRAAEKGDRATFGRLVDRHKDQLVGYLIRLTGSRDRAEDLAQETFLRLYRSFERYRRDDQLKALLFRIATNLVRSEQRRRIRWGRLAPILPSALRPANETAPDAEILGDEAQRQVTHALAELPFNFRAPLVLFEIEGYSHAEIAEILDCRPGTVKSRLHRGRAALRAKLKGYWRGQASGPSS